LGAWIAAMSVHPTAVNIFFTTVKAAGSAPTTTMAPVFFRG
jgi:hypothetical protein